MATQTFTINNGTGGQSQTSTAVLVGAGESVRVRFSSYVGAVECFLEITANATVTRVRIDDREAWATAAVISGDSVKLLALLSGDNRSSVVGIIETF